MERKMERKKGEETERNQRAEENGGVNRGESFVAPIVQATVALEPLGSNHRAGTAEEEGVSRLGRLCRAQARAKALSERKHVCQKDA